MRKMENSRVKENVRQFVLYLVVGGIATVVEWILFYILNGVGHIHYMGSTAIAFIVSTFANWMCGRILLFQKTKNIWKERRQESYLCGISSSANL